MNKCSGIHRQFQFHKGTIKTRKKSLIFATIPHFNSIKVRLKLINVLRSAATIGFQFHKGTIKTYLPTKYAIMNTNFNSIKVRLKHTRPRNGGARVPTFQFHKGTIKTSESVLGFVPRYNFNSIKVRLKLTSDLQGQSGQINFNSIKVRLKPTSLRKTGVIYTSFQFHKGTIKTSRYFQFRYSRTISIP